MALDGEVGVAGSHGSVAEPDWGVLYEQTLERAEAAEARAEELKWAEVAARTEAGSWKSRFEAACRNRQEAYEEARRVRRVAKDALFLQSEVARLARLLGEAGVDPRRRSTIMSLRMEVERPRWWRICGCASSPSEVSAPPVPRLFPNTAYGVSVWSRVLYEHYACLRPVHRVSAWLGDQGLPVAAGTLANSVPRFVALFEPLGEAIRAHQGDAALRHADETGWRVQELRGDGRSSRAWLWASVNEDSACFHIDASRSAEAAQRLFGDLAPDTVLVCDRYSAYRKLARLLGGLIVLAWCWSHQRRDFIECAAGQVRLSAWCEAWLDRIATIYRLNKVRLSHYDPALECQSTEFDMAQVALVAALDRLFERAARELAGLSDEVREGRALRSLVNHREGLSVFVDRPQVPMDNNLVERILRTPVTRGSLCTSLSTV